MINMAGYIVAGATSGNSTFETCRQTPENVRCTEWTGSDRRAAITRRLTHRRGVWTRRSIIDGLPLAKC